MLDSAPSQHNLRSRLLLLFDKHLVAVYDFPLVPFALIYRRTGVSLAAESLAAADLVSVVP